jgi:hypothetical protein
VNTRTDNVKMILLAPFYVLAFLARRTACPAANGRSHSVSMGHPSYALTRRHRSPSPARAAAWT